MKKAVAAVVLVAMAAALGYWYFQYGKTPEPPAVATAVVTRGDIVETVGATGTLQAVTTVQVGTQVSGTIQSLNADFNSLVKKGQVLARLDPSLFQTQIEQARANLIRAQADLERLRVGLGDAETKLTRARELSGRQLIPRTELEAAEVAVRSAQAQIRSADAQVTQAQASLNQNQVNLEHTVITAPIDGLVISRNVDVGQTVAASMQAPTLFVLAADLTKMQVVANLDESDVGRIRPNQSVTFRVDAYPEETFSGTVSQVRLEPKVQQNVVTYATVIDVPNDDLKLKPGMTANVDVEIARASNVLRIPNAALRFRPTAEIFAALGQPPPEPLGRGGAGGRGAGGGRGTDGAAGAAPAGSAPADGRPARPGSAETPVARGTTGQAGDAPRRGRGNAQAQPGRRAAATAPGAPEQTPDAADRAASPGRGAGGRGLGRGQLPTDPEARRAFLEQRLQNLPPERREALLERLRAGGRGQVAPSASASDAAQGRGRPAQGGPSRNPARDDGSLVASGAATIDALFAPLPRTESTGRIWIFAEGRLRPVRLRLGISDGQQTELIEGDVDEGTAVVTNVTMAGQATRPAASTFPFGQPGRGGFPGAGFPGGGGPRNGGTRTR